MHGLSIYELKWICHCIQPLIITVFDFLTFIVLNSKPKMIEYSARFLILIFIIPHYIKLLHTVRIYRFPCDYLFINKYHNSLYTDGFFLLV